MFQAITLYRFVLLPLILFGLASILDFCSPELKFAVVGPVTTVEQKVALRTKFTKSARAEHPVIMCVITTINAAHPILMRNFRIHARHMRCSLSQEYYLFTCKDSEPRSFQCALRQLSLTSVAAFSLQRESHPNQELG